MRQINSVKKGFMVSGERLAKAQKISAVLIDFLEKEELKDMRILDIGCGNGEISYYLSKENEVYSVDINDQIKESCRESIDFRKIESEQLPFKDASFDIVLSNHVIEHLEDPDEHFKEIQRVLRKQGLCYFATPNKNYPIEPHYKIPLIHYFPKSIFNCVLKKMKVFTEELNLLTYSCMKKKIRDSDFYFRDYTAKILKSPEQFYLGISFSKHMPYWLWKRLSWISPTSIFVIQKK